MIQEIELVAKKSLVGKRLDLAMVDGVKACLGDVQNCLSTREKPYVNSRRVRISSRALAFGDKLQFRFKNEPRRKQEVPSLNETHLLYHENGIIAINKPAGMSSQ